jgi:quercetin dioxygenase-like cupin family protein
MATLETKSLDSPDEEIRFPLGNGAVVTVGGVTIGRFDMEPGWRWSEHEKPLVGTTLCEEPHTLYVVAGRLHVLMEDGAQAELEPGMVAAIPPRHDGWVVGDEACRVIEFTVASGSTPRA